MARTLLDFAKSLDRRAAAVSDFGSARSKRITMAVIKYLAYNTPVDTSRALSNWLVTVGERAMAARGAFFVGSAGSTQSASAQNTILFAQAALENKKPGESIYISNLLPYIRKLNDGTHSTQPGGFVEVAHLLARTTK